MKNLVAACLISLIPFLTVDAKESYKFFPDTAQVTGLVYGPGIEHGAAIVDDKILYEGSKYWVVDDKLVKVNGKRALVKIPKDELLVVGKVSKDGVVLTYQGRTITRPLKGKK